MPNLTVKWIEKQKKPGLYGDDKTTGLYLRVGHTGTKSWVLRVMVHGRRRELGLGSTDLIDIEEARDEARRLRKIARHGGDPTSARNKGNLTFEQAARKKHSELIPTWRSAGHGERWIGSLENYAFPVIGNRRIDTVSSGDIMEVLMPIWTAKHDTARRVLQRIGLVIDWSKGKGLYPNENPISGVRKAMPKVTAKATHMPSLPWRDLQSFMSELSERQGISARCLEFLILTCARSGEARGARWSEIEGNVWTIPAERMKAGELHRVPLSTDALAILEKVRGLDGELVFPSAQRGPRGQGRVMSDTVFAALFKRMKREGFTTHGFRTTFRVWATEYAHADADVAETALAHSVGNKVRQAYERTDFFDRRMPLMDAWSRFATGQAGEVIELVRA